MPTPDTSSGVISIKPSGNVLIDTLIGNKTRWANSEITYSFPGSESYWSTDTETGYGPSSDHGREPWNTSFLPISSSDRTFFIDALERWENVANIRFKFVQETPNNVGDIRVAYTNTDDAQAWTYTPSSQAEASGDIWINRNSTSADEEWEVGSYSFLTIMHEIGHALGLGHPFIDAYFPIFRDTRSETIMSYSAIAGDKNSYFSVEPATPMPLDILAIQYLYGKNETYHNGNDNYIFNEDETHHGTIWDSGGTNDWFTYNGFQNSIIDLGEGMGSYIGNPVYAINWNTQSQVPNIWIAYDTVIENVKGGSGYDRLIGNYVDNYLDGGNGNDDLDGQGGSDFLLGGVGNDILRAGYEFDELNGGTGNDVFGFYAEGHFIVDDFNSREDLFFFDPAIGYHNLHDLVSNITNINQEIDRAVVEFGEYTSIELVGVHINEITADMIIFSL